MALYQLQYQGSTAAGETWNFSWWGSALETIDSMSTIAQDWISTFWTGGYDAFVTPDVTVDAVNVREIVAGTGGQVRLREAALSLAGVSASPALPGDVAIVVSLRTDLANRRGRGRFYLPQPAENAVGDEGRIDGAAVTAILSALQSAWNGTASSVDTVVYSRTNRTFENVVTYNIGDLFDTQRRRENKLLENRTSNVMPT